MRRKIRRKRGPVVSKKVTVDGIKFASGLEAYMYKALKKAFHMKDNQMVKVIWLIEEIKKF